jgi:hypothetical protein
MFAPKVVCRVTPWILHKTAPANKRSLKNISWQANRVVRSLWCGLVMSGAMAGCGISDLSAGTPYPGNPPSGFCTTGTSLALSVPAPGATDVPVTLRGVTIASSSLIHVAGASLWLVAKNGNEIGPRLIEGPVSPPTGVPSPFPSPVFYSARGFRLRPNRSYFVSLSIAGSACAKSPISQATFKTGPF